MSDYTEGEQIIMGNGRHNCDIANGSRKRMQRVMMACVSSLIMLLLFWGCSANDGTRTIVAEDDLESMALISISAGAEQTLDGIVQLFACNGDVVALQQGTEASRLIGISDANMGDYAEYQMSISSASIDGADLYIAGVKALENNVQEEETTIQRVGLFNGQNNESIEFCRKISFGSDESSKVHIVKMVVDDNSNLYSHWQSGLKDHVYMRSGVLVLDNLGNHMFVIEPDRNVIAIESDNYGRVYVLLDDMSLHMISIQKKELIDLKVRFGHTFTGMYSGGENQLYFVDKDSLYSFDVERCKLFRNLNWYDYGIVDSVESVVICEDRIYFSTLENLYLLCPEEIEDERTTIRVATDYPYALSIPIKRFNESQSDYKILVQEVTKDNIDQFNAQLMSGDIPDIIFYGPVLDTPLSPKAYVARGLLADVYEFIDSDPLLSRESFVENILQAAEDGGKIYQMPIEYSLFYLMGLSEVVGDEMGWTIDEMTNLIDAYPQVKYPFGPEMSQVDTLQMLLTFMIDDYVDWEEGRCDFEQESFNQLFLLAEKQPQEWISNAKATPILIHEREQLLYYAVTSNVSTYQIALAAMNNENATAIGFPVEYMIGNAVGYSYSFSISESSQYKAVAWEFMRSFLVDEYQSETFPCNSEALEAFIDDTGVIGAGTATFGTGDGQWKVDLCEPSKDHIEQLYKIIQSVSMAYQFDEDIFNIIEEEARRYFSGDKSLSDVRYSVQNRVQLYLNEIK